MRGHKIIFYGEMWLIIPKLSLLPLLIWSTDIPLGINAGGKTRSMIKSSIKGRSNPFMDGEVKMFLAIYVCAKCKG